MLKCCLVCSVALAAAQCAAWPEEGPEYRLGIHLESAVGVSSSQGYDYVKALYDVMNEEYGYNMIMERFSSHREVQKALIDDRIDGGFLVPGHIVEIIDSGTEMIPVTTYVIGKKRRSAYCLWEKKTEALKDVSEVGGKTVIIRGLDVLEFLQLREYMFANGTDVPLWDVFDTFTRVSGQNSAFIALAMGKADFYWEYEDAKFYIELVNSTVAAKIAGNLCTDNIYSRESTVMKMKPGKEEELKKFSADLKDFYVNIKKYAKDYTALQAPLSYMRMTKIRLIPARDDEFETELGLFRKAKENGWLEEARYIVKILKDSPLGQPVAVSPNLEYCKKKCDEGNNDCIVACLQ
ncbi:hypothetical protein ACFLQK_00715 [bacterium]